MAFNPTATSQVGTGNPYFGSGFMNFDRYLQDENIDWGAEQSGPMQNTNSDWTSGNEFNNWMINRAAPLNRNWEGVHPPHQPLPIPRPPGPDSGREAAPDYSGPAPTPPGPLIDQAGTWAQPRPYQPQRGTPQPDTASSPGGRKEQDWDNLDRYLAGGW